MQVDLGAQVKTDDGQPIGAIERVIVRPETGEVRAVVIGAGSIVPHRIEVQIESLDADASGDLRVTYPADEIRQWPAFDERNYRQPETGYQPPAGFSATEVLWPSGYVGPPPTAPGGTASLDQAVKRERAAIMTERDLENAIIRKGSTIRSRGGREIGTVSQLTFDEETRQLVSFSVSPGPMFSKETELSAALIDEARGGTIMLAVDEDELRAEGT